MSPPNIRFPLTPKENDEWQKFIAFCDANPEQDRLIEMELERLVSIGNPAAQRLRERIEIANHKPRKPGEPGKPPPEIKRFKVYLHEKGTT
jgi:hypothetical protein